MGESMKETLNLKHKMGQGISIQQFIDGMQTREMKLSNLLDTKARFINYYENFSWTHEEDKSFFNSLGKHTNLYCLILCTDWCPDVIWNAPVLFRVMEQSKIPTEVLLMEDHLETMDLFLINGGRAQPIAVILNLDGDVLGKWGARPRYIQDVMDEFKKTNPDKDAPDYQEKVGSVYRKIGEIYNSGTKYQDVIVQELRQLFSRFGFLAG
jgi:hypothetical protein